MEESLWTYENTPVVLHNKSSPVFDNLTVAGVTFAFSFVVEDDNGVCITTSAKITITPQHFSTAPFVELKCTNLKNTMTIPVTVEGEVMLVSYYNIA